MEDVRAFLTVQAPIAGAARNIASVGIEKGTNDMARHRKPSNSQIQRRMGMGVATAALGVTGLGLVATTAQAAEAAPAGKPVAGNSVDGHQLKGSGKGAQMVLDGLWSAGKSLLGLDREPPLATPTHSLPQKVVQSGAHEGDASVNSSYDNSAYSDNETVSFPGSDSGYADDVPVEQPYETMAPDDDVNWPSDPEPSPNQGSVFDLDGDNGSVFPADFAR
ncbi:hypothetical protein AB0D11_41990 [Streptomyces monashensis]|uniref:hypothetical protein n=1 Tax=Streptomyces monashensis TaxID=1678012 RepID=UPI00340AC8FB